MEDEGTENLGRGSPSEISAITKSTAGVTFGTP
jgi:hypothetical protein